MAEVKVKITAQNQTQTGFQAVLADAQKTATQVQNTFARASEIRTFKPKELSSGPISVDIGDYGLEPLRELQKQIAEVRRSAREALDPEVAENFSGGIGGLIGRFAILIGVAATVGKILASAFDTLSEAVKTATANQEQFNRSIEAAGTATSFEGAISGFKQLSASAQQSKKDFEEAFGSSPLAAFGNLLLGRPRQFLAGLGDAAVAGAASREMRDGEQRQGQTARELLTSSLERQFVNAQELAAAGADPAAIEQVQIDQSRREQREQLVNLLKDENAEYVKAKQLQLEAIFAEEDRARAIKEAAEAEKEATREKEKQAALESGTRAGNVRGRQLGPGSFEGIAEFERERARALKELGPEFGPGTADAALGGFRVDESRFAKEQQAEALKLLQAERKIEGGIESSGLQRIGFSSNEFFDTRRTDDPLKRAADDVRKIAEILRRGEPLVLPASN